MDRHDVSETVTAENVAQLHKEDLKIQHKFDCKGLTYWFDEDRNTAFCLIEAPDAQAIKNMHKHAHGEVPHQVIEVEPNIVESFLGRIEDPKKAQNSKLNIINDPAFRTIMVIGFNWVSLKKTKESQTGKDLHVFRKDILNLVSRNNGSVVKQNDEFMMVSFKSVSNALKCAVEVQSKFTDFTADNFSKTINLNIGLSAGIPVTEKKALFEDTIKLAEILCFIANAKILVSAEVKDLYKSENQNTFVDNKLVSASTPSDEIFLSHLMDYVEKTWRNTDLMVDDFGKHLGYSKSQLYRKMTSLTGKSPNTLIKEYRLTEALSLLARRTATISEIAFESGFSSPSYFSKCFQKRYGLLPSDYL